MKTFDKRRLAENFQLVIPAGRDPGVFRRKQTQAIKCKKTLHRLATQLSDTSRECVDESKYPFNRLFEEGVQGF